MESAKKGSPCFESRNLSRGGRVGTVTLNVPRYGSFLISGYPLQKGNPTAAIEEDPRLAKSAVLCVN
jgi:hypothetical protein